MARTPGNKTFVFVAIGLVLVLCSIVGVIGIAGGRAVSPPPPAARRIETVCWIEHDAASPGGSIYGGNPALRPKGSPVVPCPSR